MNKIEILKNFATNIEHERIELGLTQFQMASRLDLSISSYKRILTNETTKLDASTLLMATKITDKSAHELCNVNSPCIEVLKKLRLLSSTQLLFINSIIDFEIDFRTNLPENDYENDYISVLVPTGNMQDGMVYDSTNVEKINISPYKKKFGDLIHFGIKITSIHLQPVYNPGDILLVCTNPIRDGDTGIFVNKDNNCAYIRKFHQTKPCILEPVNHYGQTFYIDPDDRESMNKWIKSGYILTKIRI